MNNAPIKDFQAHVSKERTHLSQVRRAFTTGLEIETIDPSLVNFYVVCCDYLEYALSRLIAQDYILHDLLVPHIEPKNQEYLDKLTRLQKGLNAMESAIEKLSTAKNNLIKSGLYETEEFKEEALSFLDVFLNMLASNRHSTIDLEQKVFTPKDWEKLAGVTEESIQMEEKLFLNTKLSAPKGCDPDNFPPLGHHQQPS
jgi:hypothetical protein